jgi:diamine N-acetyltransferase
VLQASAPLLRTRRGRALRLAEPEDARAVAALEIAPAQRPFIVAWTHEQHRRAIENDDFRYLLYERDGGLRAYVILAGLRQAHRSVEIIRMVSDGKGFGVGGDLLDAIVRHAFVDLGAHRMWSDCFDDNLPARKMCAHFGFREEGLMRDALFFDGRYRSVVILGLLEAEAAAILARR